MARRRRINAPSAEELRALEEGFARETDGRPGLPPIAQVAAEAARLTDPDPAETRVARARDETDAAAYRAARDQGLVVHELPLAEIRADALSRDRMALDPEQMDELIRSIDSHGLRFPIEVFELPEPRGAQRYGLISGYRRLMAVTALAGPEAAATTRIKALLRPSEGLPAAFVAMVEENEIRADLSQYERGRIAAVAARQGVYATVSEAVDALFHAGSKAKRSKIRSFALIHEELGDLLRFPTALSERAGLQLAVALKAGHLAALRAALETAERGDAAAEWAALEPVLTPPARRETGGVSGSAGASASGAPLSDAELAARRAGLEDTVLHRGLRLRARGDAGCYVIELSGPELGETERTAALLGALKALRDLA